MSNYESERESERLMEPLKSRIKSFLQSVRQSRFVRLRVNDSNDGREGILQWMTESGGRQTTNVGISHERQEDGLTFLRIDNWPSELEPLVAYYGVPGLCRIREIRTSFTIGTLRRPSQYESYLPRYAPDASGTLGAKDGGDHDSEIANVDGGRRLRGWLSLEAGLSELTVHAELEENSNPGMIRVIMEWVDGNNEEQRRQFTMELTEDHGEDLWSGKLAVDLPTDIGDGVIWVTAQTISRDDLIELSADDSDGELSEVSCVIGRSRFKLLPVGVKGGRLTAEVSGIDISALGKDGQQELLIQAMEKSLPDNTDEEGVVDGDEISPFERTLRELRDRMASGANVSELDLDTMFFKQAYDHFSFHLRRWSKNRLEDAFSDFVSELFEKGVNLPPRQRNENLSAWLTTRIRWELIDHAGKEFKEAKEREKYGTYRDIVNNDKQESDKLDRGVTVVGHEVAGIAANRKQKLFDAMTPEEFDYYARKFQYGHTDVRVREEKGLSDYQVRELKRRIHRKVLIMTGLNWIESNAGHGLSFSEVERVAVERREFDKLSPGKAAKEAGFEPPDRGPAFVRSAIKKVELAAAAVQLGLANKNRRFICDCFDANRVAALNPNKELVLVGRRLHAQIMVKLLSRKDLPRPEKLFLKHRVIAGKSFEQTSRVISERSPKSKTGINTVVQNVLAVMNAKESAVPHAFREVTIDWLQDDRCLED